jgi:tryptophan synthase alpha chain
MGGRLGECFRGLRERGEKALIPFVTAGDPDLDTTEAIVLALAEAGADAIEIGVPFSDPMAEGPTIQRASERALASGTALRRIIERVAALRARVELPIVLMGYTNNFLAMGARPFAEAAARAGVDGLITVDLPPEEGEAFYAEVQRAGIDPILLAAPTTERARLEMLAKQTRGFLYFVSLTGVTGARRDVSATLEQEVRAVRSISDVPVCVGFGVSTPEQARRVAGFADGVVVGSAFIDRIERAGSPEAAVDAAAAFASELKAALR